MIGRELKAGLGLIEWFLGQEGEINGFTRAVFSGVTTGELGRVIRDYVLVNPDLSGIYPVSGEPISKYELLVLAAESFGHSVMIHRFDEYVVDRSLDSSR